MYNTHTIQREGEGGRERERERRRQRQTDASDLSHEPISFFTFFCLIFFSCSYRCTGRQRQTRSCLRRIRSQPRTLTAAPSCIPRKCFATCASLTQVFSPFFFDFFLFSPLSYFFRERADARPRPRSPGLLIPTFLLFLFSALYCPPLPTLTTRTPRAVVQTPCARRYRTCTTRKK